MGMDVFGVEPRSEVGEYFRASIWMWRPIWERIRLLCSDILDEGLLSAMTYNEGAGPKDQKTCTEIAKRLEGWLNQDLSDEFFSEESSILRVTENGRLVSDEELINDPTLKTKSPYSVDRESIEEFISFLKACGGFSVR